MERFDRLRATNFSCSRSQDATAEETPQSGKSAGGGKAPQDGLQRGTIGPIETRVHREQVLDGETKTAALAGPGPERGPNQDLVPEQEGQNQEVQWAEKPIGHAAHGPRTLQPLHRSRGRGRRGNPAPQIGAVVIARFPH